MKHKINTWGFFMYNLALPPPNTMQLLYLVGFEENCKGWIRLKMNRKSGGVWKDYQGPIIVGYMFYYFHFSKTYQLPLSLKIHPLHEQRFLTGLFSFHLSAHLLPVHCRLKAVRSYFTTLFNPIVTILYLGKLRSEKLLWNSETMVLSTLALL